MASKPGGDEPIQLSRYRNGLLRCTGCLLQEKDSRATRLLFPPPVTDWGGVPILIAMSIAGILVYGGILMLTQKPLVQEVKALFSSLSKKNEAAALAHSGDNDHPMQ